MVKLELVPASGGIFEVTVNNQLLYSKKETGRFPKSADIIQQMEAL
ncbi:Rdx family protein [Peribacillus sp. SCS-37]